MVGAEATAVVPPVADAPSMGPSSIPYVPPTTLEEAVIRARVQILQRNRRGGLALVLAVILYTLPWVAVLILLFPSDPLVTVGPATDLYVALVTGAYLFLMLAAYRVLTGRPGVSYGALAVGIVLVAFDALQVALLLLLYLAWSPSVLVDQASYLWAMIVPLLAMGGGVASIAGGAFALPRRVRASADA